MKKKISDSSASSRAPMLRKKIKINERKLNGIKFKIANSFDELCGAFSLVHDEYVRHGYMEKHATGMRIIKHNTLPDATTVVGKVNSNVVLTMSLFPDSEYGLPMDTQYKEEINKLRSQKRCVAEVGSFAAHPGIRKHDPNIPMHGYKIIHYYATKHLGLDDIVAAINPKHRLFYEWILLFEQIGGEKDYGCVNNAPAIVMRLDLGTMKSRYQQFYAGAPKERDLHNFFFKSVSQSIQLPENKVTNISPLLKT